MAKQKTKQRKPVGTLLAALGVTLLGIIILFLEDETVEYLLVLFVSISLLIGGISFMIQSFKIKKYLVGILGMALYLLIALVLLSLQYYFRVITIMPSLLVGIIALIVGVVRAAICVNCFMNGFRGGIMNGVFAIIMLLSGLSLAFFPLESIVTLRYIIALYMIIYAITLFGDFYAGFFSDGYLIKKRKLLA